MGHGPGEWHARCDLGHMPRTLEVIAGKGLQRTRAVDFGRGQRPLANHHQAGQLLALALLDIFGIWEPIVLGGKDGRACNSKLFTTNTVLQTENANNETN